MIRVIRKTFCVFILLFLAFVGGLSAQDVYVSSSRGQDSNDGLTPETPVKTIKTALAKGKTIYLVAGDVFYEYVELYDNKLSRYGEGHNPKINGFRTIVGRPWQMVDNHIWKIDLKSIETTGFQVDGSSELNNVGCIYEVERDCLHGRKCHKYSELQKDWDFFQTDLQTYKSIGNSCFDELFLYYVGNPNDLVLSISVGSHYGITLNNSTVECVNVKGFGTGDSCWFIIG